jgi:hypothetical protein
MSADKDNLLNPRHHNSPYNVYNSDSPFYTGSHFSGPLTWRGIGGVVVFLVVVCPLLKKSTPVIIQVIDFLGSLAQAWASFWTS